MVWISSMFAASTLREPWLMFKNAEGKGVLSLQATSTSNSIASSTFTGKKIFAS